MEGLTQEQINQEARELYRAEKDKSVLRPFTEKYPKIAPEESYRIQLALIEMKSRRRQGRGEEDRPHQQGDAENAQRRSA